MATHRLAPGVRLVLAFALMSSFAAAQSSPFTWDIAPDPPNAGQEIKVQVDVAPCYPVYVQLYINGVPGLILEITSQGGSCSFPNSGSTTGDTWCVRIWCGTDAARKVGVF